MFTRSSSFFSSSWERKAPAAFFHKGGRQTLLAGEGGPGLQNRSAGLHLPCKSAGNNRPPMRARVGGAREGSWDSAYRGTPPRLDPRTSPKCANTVWELGGWSSSRPSLWHFLLQHAQDVWEGPGSGRGGYTPQQF